MTKLMFGLLVSTALVLAGCTKTEDANEKVTNDTVKIGVLTDMSGLYSDIGGKGSIVAAELAVDAGQQVEVEAGVDPAGVVVGGFEERRVLLEVGADDQPAAP